MASDSNFGSYANLATIIGLVGGIVYFAATLESRLSRLETQMQAITLQTTSSGSSISFVAPKGLPQKDDHAPRPKDSASDTNGATVISVNPIAKTCAEIAEKMLAAYGSTGSFPAINPYSPIMSELGCSKIR